MLTPKAYLMISGLKKFISIDAKKLAKFIVHQSKNSSKGINKFDFRDFENFFKN